ncbi:MAG: matrixin family metalloprotease [Gemmatimonadales bacterium]
MASRERSNAALTGVALLVLGAVGADLVRRGLHEARPKEPAPAASRQAGRDTIASAHGASAPADSTAPALSRIRGRIADEVDFTYIANTLLETDSTIRRWPDERLSRPLAVCVIRNRVDGFRDDFADNVNYAISRWNGVLPFGLSAGADSASADVIVTWTAQLDSGKTGRTDLTWDRRGIIRHAFVTLATHDPNGRLLDPQRMSALALHELGHALGLGHSPVREDALYPIATALELTERDRRTARLLYDLPPGSIR